MKNNSISEILADTSLWQTDLSDMTEIITEYYNKIGIKKSLYQSWHWNWLTGINRCLFKFPKNRVKNGSRKFSTEKRHIIFDIRSLQFVSNTFDPTSSIYGWAIRRKDSLERFTRIFPTNLCTNKCKRLNFPSFKTVLLPKLQPKGYDYRKIQHIFIQTCNEKQAFMHCFLHKRLFLELLAGLEPATCWLRISCSTDWATVAITSNMTNRQIAWL